MDHSETVRVIVPYVLNQLTNSEFQETLVPFKNRYYFIYTEAVCSALRRKLPIKNLNLASSQVQLLFRELIYSRNEVSAEVLDEIRKENS